MSYVSLGNRYHGAYWYLDSNIYSLPCAFPLHMNFLLTYINVLSNVSHSNIRTSSKYKVRIEFQIMPLNPLKLVKCNYTFDWFVSGIKIFVALEGWICVMSMLFFDFWSLDTITKNLLSKSLLNISASLPQISWV